MGPSLKQSTIAHLLIMTLLVLVGIVGLREGGYLEGVELDAYDWSLRFPPTQDHSSPPITIITITDEDIRQLGSWPLTDATLAKALKKILEQQPRAIGVDIYRDLEVPPGRRALNQVLKDHPEIVMVMKFGEIEKGGILGPEVLRGTDRVGFSDVVVDGDGVVRRGLFYLDDGTSFASSLALGLALKYLKKDGIGPQPASENPSWMRLGKTVFRPFEGNDGSYVAADAQGYQFLLDLKRKDNLFHTISFWDLLSGAGKPDWLKEKIVLVGVVAEGVKDFFYTSQCSRFGACPKISGVELHGHMVWQLLRAAKDDNALMRTYPDSMENAWIGLWVVLGTAIGAWVRGAWRFAIVVGLGIVGLWGLTVGGVIQGVWIPFVPSALGMVLSATVVTAYVSNKEKKERNMLMSLFSRHVSAEVAEDLWEKRDQILENGRVRPNKLVVTTLFTDLEGFTTIAEGMEPQALLNWLNRYMETMVKIIADHGGVVDDYYGDMIKAGFGVITTNQTEEDIRREATQAVSCAIAMEKDLVRLNREWQQQGLPTIRMRVGINTGPVVAGSLGSAQRLKFTTIGDSVNIASRLESYHKDSTDTWVKDEFCRILIGETTKQYVKNHEWKFEEVGVVTLKGKSIGLPVFRLHPNA